MPRILHLRGKVMSLALVRTVTSILLAGIVTACGSNEPSQPSAASAAATSTLPQRVEVKATTFVRSDGQTFQWRGVTAFRLLEYVAHGREADALAYLDWAKSQQLTVVRVLTMMAGQFELSPADGRRALPRLLELAASRGLYVEVVALAGTKDIPVNLEEHITAIGKILESHPNAFLEIANEPVHPSQSAAVQNPDVLKALAHLVAPSIPVSLGSIERGDGFGAGSYITWHAPRESGNGGWGHVLALAAGAELLERWKKPVISDEPIGAGSQAQPGRRDNDPARFRAAAILTRLVGLGATFHYEAGLQARVPEGPASIEAQCFAAWNEAWTLLPPDVEQRGAFREAGGTGSAIATWDRERVIGVFERTDDRAGWVLVVGDQDAVLIPSSGWTVRNERRIDGGRVLSVER
jgi:hypothetical protein